VILILSGRPGRALFFAKINSSFWAFFSLDKTG
jgi:hypothetical protein